MQCTNNKKHRGVSVKSSNEFIKPLCISFNDKTAEHWSEALSFYPDTDHSEIEINLGNALFMLGGPFNDFVINRESITLDQPKIEEGVTVVVGP